MIKNLILVIVGGVVIGVGVFYGEKTLRGSLGTNIVRHQENIAGSEINSIPTPTVKPAAEPLNENTNLGEEIERLTPPDFSEDFQKLKDQVSQ
jgi:hypothetical protein